MVDNHHIIQSSGLTSSHTQDQSMIESLLAPVKEKIRHITADSAYDNNPTYKRITRKFPGADIVIAPHKDVIEHNENEFYRNRKIREIKYYGHMGWQKRREYGKRNNSELAILRYKRILGNRLHAREFQRQRQEAIIGCSILNKMICITAYQIHKKILKISNKEKNRWLGNIAMWTWKNNMKANSQRAM